MADRLGVSLPDLLLLQDLLVFRTYWFSGSLGPSFRAPGFPGPFRIPRFPDPSGFLDLMIFRCTRLGELYLFSRSDLYRSPRLYLLSPELLPGAVGSSAESTRSLPGLLESTRQLCSYEAICVCVGECLNVCSHPDSVDCRIHLFGVQVVVHPDAV